MEIVPSVGQNYAFFLLGKLEECYEAGEAFQVLVNRMIQRDESGQLSKAKVANSQDAREIMSVWFGRMAALWKALYPKVMNSDKAELKKRFDTFRPYAYSSYLLYDDVDKAIDLQAVLWEAVEYVTKITEFEKTG